MICDFASGKPCEVIATPTLGIGCAKSGYGRGTGRQAKPVVRTEGPGQSGADDGADDGNRTRVFSLGSRFAALLCSSSSDVAVAGRAKKALIRAGVCPLSLSLSLRRTPHSRSAIFQIRLAFVGAMAPEVALRPLVQMEITPTPRYRRGT